MRLRLLLTLLVFATVNTFAADNALPEQARAALEKATGYMRSISTEGGYLWKYALDLSERAGEVKATATQIWIQPPGTPTMGMTFLRAYEATKDARCLDAAKAAADALARGQVESGGWDYLIDFHPEKMKLIYLRSDIGKLSPDEIAKRKNLTTFDDNNTQSALQFLLALADVMKESGDARDKRDSGIREALDHGLKKMIGAQFPNGAWPQRWHGAAHMVKEFPIAKARYPESWPHEWPKTNYYAHYTLNDNTHMDCIAVMFDAFHRTGKRECLDAARRGGDFLILAQMPEPQPVWAQQYNAQMEPVWARAFEPPGVTGDESVGAMEALMDLYVETGEEKFLKPLPAAISWFKRSEIAPGKWARYYELKTNRQLFGDRDGKIYYKLGDISEERQHGYSWQGDYHVPRMLAAYEKLQGKGRDAILKQRDAKAAKKGTSAKSLEPRVREIIAALDDKGRWVTKGHAKHRDWKFNGFTDTEVFVKNVGVLCEYLEAAR